jgi:O-antigen/teichoic acid export membrane protein
MLFTMGVSLYTSRVVLEILGVEDFGIYGVVGGVVAIFSFLNTSMSGATSRFLTFELGQGNYEKLREIFSTALTIHFIIAAIILILGETVGLWWLENKLVIPAERMPAARWIYQLSILGVVVGITQVPYNAMIIAHERMGVFAFVEILNKLLQLGIVLLLLIGNFDRLILYAILMLCVTIIITIVYKLYCTKNFAESHYRFVWDKEIVKPMLSFSGWNLYGTFAFTVKTQGVNILLNSFFGVVVNAAYGIATQVQGAIQAFSANFITAANPQVIKYYAANEMGKMQDLIVNVAKFSFLLLFAISLPVIIETQFIVQLWLKNVPDYVVVFCKLNLISGLLTGMFTIITTAIYATGKLKFWSIISSTIYILVIPFSYILLKRGFSPEIPFVVNIVLLFIGYISNLYILKSLVPDFSVSKFFTKVIFLCIFIALISSLLPVYVYYHLNEGWTRFLLICISSTCMIVISTYFLGINKELRNKGWNLVMKKLHK